MREVAYISEPAPLDPAVFGRRFQVRQRLGAGGFGTVYEAFDRERSATVALKVLRRSDGPSVSRFKREFRSLAETSHPNLVQLYELHAEGDAWFFTMELISGEHENSQNSLTGPEPSGTR